MGRNIDFTGLAILLGLGYLVYKVELGGLGAPGLPSLPTVPSLPSIIVNLLSGNGQAPYQPAPYRRPYTPPPPLELTESQQEQLIGPRPIRDFHKELRKAKGKAARFIIERKIAPAPTPKRVKDLHKEMTALKTQTGTWIAKHPELWNT